MVGQNLYRLIDAIWHKVRLLVLLECELLHFRRWLLIHEVILVAFRLLRGWLLGLHIRLHAASTERLYWLLRHLLWKDVVKDLFGAEHSLLLGAKMISRHCIKGAMLVLPLIHLLSKICHRLLIHHLLLV